MSAPSLPKVVRRLCTGCRSCEAVCSTVHFGVTSPARSRVQVTADEVSDRFFPAVCRGCARPACVDACDGGALFSRGPGKAVGFDADRCDGCGACVDACPLDAVFFDRKSMRPLICDGCGGRPACVDACLTGALRAAGAKEQ